MIRRSTFFIILGVALLGLGAYLFMHYRQIAPTTPPNPLLARNAAIRDNLLRLGQAADDYFAAHPAESSVSGEALRTSAAGLTLSPQVGENYDQLQIHRGWLLLSVKLPSGPEISVPRRAQK